MHRIYKIIVSLLGIVFMFFGTETMAQQIDKRYPLIPFPKRLEAKIGEFKITNKTPIVVTSKFFANEVKQLNGIIKNGFGTRLAVERQPRYADSQIIFKYDESILNNEGYKITVNIMQVILSARTSSGMFMAVETIRQLLPVSVEKNTGSYVSTLVLPAVEIEDEPTYSYRGMMLDVSRHFFSINYLKRFVDRLALYKMNKFHLHLTDDQGWRVEIKKYPKLTEQGAWRTFNNQDSICMKRALDNPDFEIDEKHIIERGGKKLYGGFYTQDELMGLVAYAAERHIEIIPEIDMPGHMMAAINAYPFLTCNGDNSWGVLFTKPICPINESTYEFAQNVFTEIMDIFPSQYIHIGGDEVDHSDWEKSAAVKAFMEREGIKTMAALQSYFINRMEQFFISKGRKMIGWDEILEGGVSKTANIMYWRSWVPNAPIKAAKSGNNVIMSPGNPLYFDSEQDRHSLSKVYHFNPIPSQLNEQESKTIIGAQANLWTEWIPSERRADFMVFPRMTALAEVLWTGDKSNYDMFHARLKQQYKRLDALGVNYRLPDLEGILNDYVFVDKIQLNLIAPLRSMKIHYTLDGSVPNINSPILSSSLKFNTSTSIKLAGFGLNGIHTDYYTTNLKKRPVQNSLDIKDQKQGLVGTLHKGQFSETAKIAFTAVDSIFTADVIEVPTTIKAPSFAIGFKGFIAIPTSGTYTFFLTCDDGGTLKIANDLIVDNDGNHYSREKSGQAVLQKGLHPFELNFIEAGGGYNLKLTYTFNGSKAKDIPAQWFKN